MLYHHLKSALRHLKTNWVFTGLNLLGLSSALAIVLCIILWSKNELSFDEHPIHADRIYRVLAEWHLPEGDIWHMDHQVYPMGTILGETASDVEALTRLYVDDWNDPIIRFKDQLLKERKAAYVDDNWFEFFKSGEGYVPRFSSLNSVILTQRKAKQIFGSVDPTGRVLEINGQDFEVAEVMDDPGSNSSFQFDLYLPINARLADSAIYRNDMSWGNWNYKTFIRLHPKAQAEAVTEIISGIAKGHQNSDLTYEFNLEPLEDLHFNAQTPLVATAPIGNRRTIFTFALVGFLILLSACFNYINLTIANVSRREKEVGLRKIIGATKKGIFSKFLLESLVLVMLALGCSLLLVHWIMPFLNNITGSHLQMNLADPTIWILLLCVILICTIVASTYPALVGAAIKPLDLVSSTRRYLVKAYTRKTMTTLQFALSTCLIICTIVIYLQQRYVQSTDLGFETEQVFSFSVPNRADVRRQAETFMPLLEDQLARSPAVSKVAYVNEPPVNVQSYSAGDMDWPGRDESFEPKHYQLSTSVSGASLLDLKLKEGRWFDEKISLDRNNIIVNQKMADLLNVEQVVGLPVKFKNEDGTILGIVEDLHFQSLHSAMQPLVIMHKVRWCTDFLVKASGENMTEAIGAAEEVWQRHFPDTPFEYTFLDDSYAALYASEEISAQLFRIFSLFAVLISCLGLVGLTTFTVRQKFREIGIRKVMGASVKDIVSLLLNEYLAPIFVSVVLACAVGHLLMRHYLDDYAYAIDLSWWIFALGAGIMTLLALLSVGSISYKAALANPVESIREE